MDYNLSEDQAILKDEFQKLLAKECTSDTIREMMASEKGYSELLWQKMAELGWMGLLIPEAYDGAYESFIDMLVLLYEMGYACLPGPFFSTAVVGTLTLLEAGNEAQKKTILPKVATGEHLLALAWTESTGTYTPKGIQMKAEQDGDDFILNGTKLFVPDAHVADTIFCVARTDESKEAPEKGVSLFAVDADSEGLSIHPHKTFTGEKLSEVAFDQVRLPGTALMGPLNQAWPILQKILMTAVVAKSADMSGGAQKVLEMAVSHAKVREQFDRPIGSFQAVQHHCANMVIEADVSRFMTYHAGWRIDEGLDFTKEAAMCKAWVSESYRRLVLLGHQVLGGISFTLEEDMHLYTYRAKGAELFFGDADFHREMVARSMNL